MFFNSVDIGIDLGTANILVFIKGKGIVLNEPSVVAIDKDKNKILAVGEEARQMIGRTPGNIVAIRPLKEGVIANYTITQKMLEYVVNKVAGKSFFSKPRIMVCIPTGVTSVEKRAVLEATMQAGASKTYLIEEPLAAALGAGLAGNRKQIHNKINMVSRFNMLIAIPCAVGFVILAKPLLDLLYFTQDNTKPALMLQLGALSVVFFCLSTVTNSVLQGLDDMMTPVRNAAISLVIHVIALFLMMVVFKWNIYAVVLSKIVFSGASCILNAHSLRERIGYVQERKKTFVIPTIAATIMGVVAVVVHLLFELFAGARIATVVAVLVAVIVYGAVLVLLGGVTEEELLDMPKGASMVSLCRKLHLIRGQYR